MSTALAIAATTRVLGALIDQNIQNANVSAALGPPPYLTTLAPDQLEASGDEAAQLSLFLYHVTYNQGWREVCLPSRDSSGTRIDRPPLALDLHYLLVAYGQTDYVPQMLLGLGMQALHETPFLGRNEITAVFTPPPPLSTVDTALSTAELAAQVEMIKVTPEPLTTEDLSKLWTAFGGKFRPSAGYEATVVLIESTAPIQTALQVTHRPKPLVVQFAEPTITGVTPQFVQWTSPPRELTLIGTNLTATGSVVLFTNDAAAPQTPQPVGTGSSQATVTVPTLLPAGMNTLQIVQQAAIGAAPPKTILQSNAALFYLQPVIQQDPNPPNDYVITVGPVDNTKTPPVTPITVQLDPAVNPGQQVQLLLNQLNPPAGAAPLAFTFDADPAQSGNSMTFSTTGVAGTYLVRVRVDGAASVLQTDATGAFSEPTVTL